MQTNNEIWKDVKGFEGRYKISNTGNLKSINGRFKGEKIIAPNKVDSNGYINVSLRSTKHGVKRKCVRIHQIVAENFLEKPITSERLEIDHKDSVKTNNHADNLRYLTATEHRSITISKGEMNLKGENHPQAKVSRTDVLEMRFLIFKRQHNI